MGGPLKLEKQIGGGMAMLRIKNKTDNTIRLLSVLDSVPRGSFIRCSITPEIEEMGSTADRLRWTILQLRPKEEIVIEYEARGFCKGFSVETQGKRYQG